ncbi:co-chaperone GroES [Aerococcaceae bacterium DSM 111176]|nr:co-chaperone GroES [Aerococcaceae bacterium DSM 111176]
MIKPLGKRVVIQIAEVEQVTESGFILPTSAQEKEQFGEIVAVGPEIEEKDAVAVGDKVYFKNFTGTEVEHGGQEYLIIEYKDLLAKLD